MIIKENEPPSFCIKVSEKLEEVDQHLRVSCECIPSEGKHLRVIEEVIKEIKIKAKDFDLPTKIYHESPSKYLIREQILDEIAKEGAESFIQSLLDFSICMEDLASPSIHFNDRLDFLKKIISSLGQVKNLIIIDPYFFKNNANENAQFMDVISILEPTLERICFFCKKGDATSKQSFLNDFKKVYPKVNISTKDTDIFHDRWWINPEDELAIDFGTSWNGLFKKLSRVTPAGNSDKEALLALFKESPLKEYLQSLGL